MSKQYLTLHTLDSAHPTDILALAPTRTTLLSASGSSTLQIHSTTSPDFPHIQSIPQAHKLGIHHLVTSREGKTAASAGFEGEAKIWSVDEEGKWSEKGVLKNHGTEIWAVALSADGAYLAGTGIDGKISVWDLGAEGMPKIREYETKGSFGMCVDLSADGRFTASGHESGNIYIFNNDSGRMSHSLSSLVKCVRAVAFSPASKLVAAAGDSRIIALYDVTSGEQIANLAGHGAWITTLDWSDSGEYLLSGSYDSKAKVWSIPTHTCVATHSDGDGPLWSAKWLPLTTRSEMFALAGGNKSISFYREAAG